MYELIKTMRHSMFSILFVTTFSLSASAKEVNRFDLVWVAPPPPVVVADIGEVYRIGCRVTLNSSNTHDFDLNDVKLSAGISQVK